MNYLDTSQPQSSNRITVNGIPSGDSLLNQLTDRTETQTSMFPGFSQSGISFLQGTNPIIGSGILDLQSNSQNISTSNPSSIFPSPHQIFSSNTLNLEQENSIPNYFQMRPFQTIQQLQMPQQIFSHPQYLQQQFLQNAQTSLLQQQPQVIPIQQQMLQQHQLLVQLGIINNPSLIMQLQNTVTNPVENARFSKILRMLLSQQTQTIAPPSLSLSQTSQLQSINSQSQLQAAALVSNQNLEQKLIMQQKQKEELTDMLVYLVEKMHQVDTDEIFEKKKQLKFLKNDCLNIFDNIVHKYQFSRKTKEEMIKYILRKCFKFLKSNIKQQELIGQKDIEVAFTRKYFGVEIDGNQQLQFQKQFLAGGKQSSKESDDSEEEMNDYQVKEEQDLQISSRSQLNITSQKNLLASSNHLETENVIEKVMPFKQGSKIKTMNIQFLKMIFRSDIFVKDYQNYLEKFEELANKENQKKIQKCVKNLQEFIDKGQINKVKSYKRLPWLKIWLKETQELAKTLCIYANEDNQKDFDGISSNHDLKKKLKISESPPKYPGSKTNEEESESEDENNKQEEIINKNDLNVLKEPDDDRKKDLNGQANVKHEENEQLITSHLLKNENYFKNSF